jgi:hypothetical protein
VVEQAEVSYDDGSEGNTRQVSDSSVACVTGHILLYYS